MLKPYVVRVERSLMKLTYEKGIFGKKEGQKALEFIL
jgi:hypothetical protein